MPFRSLNYRGSNERADSAFMQMTNEELDAHVARDTYDDFRLTEAVRGEPGFTPKEGYRYDFWRDKGSGIKIPVIVAAATREKLIDLFDDLIIELGAVDQMVDVVLEGSHDRNDHKDYPCNELESVTLRSTLFDHEELLLNDGCTGIAVLNTNIPLEIQFTEDKLFGLYGRDLEPFEKTLQQHGLRRNQNIQFVCDVEHMHQTCGKYRQEFRKLYQQLSGDIEED